MYDADSVLLELLASGEDWAAQTLWQMLQMDRQARALLADEDVPRELAPRRAPLTRCPELLHALAAGLAASKQAAKAGREEFITPTNNCTTKEHLFLGCPGA